jgi:hypothetical protein
MAPKGKKVGQQARSAHYSSHIRVSSDACKSHQYLLLLLLSLRVPQLTAAAWPDPNILSMLLLSCEGHQC